MNVGDNAQTGDVSSGDHAGRDIRINDLNELGHILALVYDNITAWQERDEHERHDRQRDNDIRFALIESGINGLRAQNVEIRAALRWIRWLVISIAVVLLLIVVRLWPAITALAFIR